MLKKKLLPLYTDTMRILLRASKFSGSEEAQFTRDAFGVSRATVGRCKGSVQKNQEGCLIVSSPSQGDPRK